MTSVPALDDITDDTDLSGNQTAMYLAAQPKLEVSESSDNIDVDDADIAVTDEEDGVEVGDADQDDDEEYDDGNDEEQEDGGDGAPIDEPTPEPPSIVPNLPRQYDMSELMSFKNVLSPSFFFASPCIFLHCHPFLIALPRSG